MRGICDIFKQWKWENLPFGHWSQLHLVQKTFINTYCVPGPWWETEMSQNLVCAQEEREIIEVPLSPQHWLRPWDGVSGWAVRTPVLAGPGSEEGASAHGCSWMVSSSCPFPYQRNPSSFQTFYLLAPLKPGSASFPKTHQEASQVFGYLRS